MMKLSEIFELYDLSIIKDTNGDYYVKDNTESFHSLKAWTYAGNNLLSVIDMIPDSLIQSEIDDIFDGFLSGEIIRKTLKVKGVPETAEETVEFLEFIDENSYENVEGKLTLLRAIADPEKYAEDDIKQQFITKEDYERCPDFRFNFTDIGQGVGYKANISGYNWNDIPDNAILYALYKTEYFIYYREDEDDCYKALYIYTKSDLESWINERVMDNEHFIDAKTMFNELSGEMPESFLDGLNFDYKKIAYCIGDKLYYNLNEFDSPAQSLLVTVTEVNEDNIICKDSTGISYMFDEDMLDCLTNNPMYPVKKNKIKDSFERDI